MNFLHNSQKQLLVTLLSMANTLTVEADTLKDPTQPPASLYSEVSTSKEEVTSPVLQSVMIGPQLRAAIINGEKVVLGGKYQQTTLIQLNEHTAVLRNPDMTTQTLSMDYAIEKKIIAPVAASPIAKRKVKHSSKPIIVSEK
jgi:MSHA biogenesis protein MshK